MADAGDLKSSSLGSDGSSPSSSTSSGVAQSAERIPYKGEDAGSIPAPATISSVQPVKMNPAMAAFMDQVRIEVPIEELMQPVPETRYCLNTTCESVLRLVKGKLVCMDQSCGMCGQEQRGRA
jgi:hypothetical protein